MAEQQIQALTKTLNENNQILMQNCQNLFRLELTSSVRQC